MEGRYIPIEPRAGTESVSACPNVDINDWAGIALFCIMFEDMLMELEKVYGNSDALKIYCIAILRVCNLGIFKRWEI